jgi:phenylacetate-coenzyme A ligase PaaK-like adenylate-forming protein
MADDATLQQRQRDEFARHVPAALDALTWPDERRRAERERRLRELLHVARSRSPWHAARLAAIDPATATEADLARIPPMTKDEMMDHLDAVFTDARLSRALVEAHLGRIGVDDAYLLDEFHVFASGGSSGRRGVFVWDWDGWVRFGLCLGRLSMRRRMADPGLGADAVEVVVAAEKASHMTGVTTFLPPTLHRVPATRAIPDIVAELNRLQPALLRGYPTALTALAAETRAGRLRIAPRMVTAHSEPLLPEPRRAMEDAWGVPVMNGYGTTEGACGWSCASGRGLHVNDDWCIFELVDEGGRPVAAGERAAKIYVTNLMNFAQPLIRYELTDEVAAIDEPCGCGITLTRIDDIEGRTDDVFTYSGGVVVHPLAFRSPLGRERDIVEYQVQQTMRGASIRVRTSGAVDTVALSVRIAAALAATGLGEPDVSIAVVDAFERQASGKLKRFVPL